jgi:hypothetical protein
VPENSQKCEFGGGTKIIYLFLLFLSVKKNIPNILNAKMNAPATYASVAGGMALCHVAGLMSL